METITLSEMRGSEKLKIQAAVLEILEQKHFALDRDLGIAESVEDPGRWVMAFQNKKCKWEDLESVKLKLGQLFSVEITSKSKENFLFRIDAPCEEFLRLGRNLKPLAPAQAATTATQPINKNY